MEGHMLFLTDTHHTTAETSNYLIQEIRSTEMRKLACEVLTQEHYQGYLRSLMQHIVRRTPFIQEVSDPENTIQG